MPNRIQISSYAKSKDNQHYRHTGASVGVHKTMLTDFPRKQPKNFTGANQVVPIINFKKYRARGESQNYQTMTAPGTRDKPVRI